MHEASGNVPGLPQRLDATRRACTCHSSAARAASPGALQTSPIDLAGPDADTDINRIRQMPFTRE